SDGSEVEQCGNGARCFARFVKERELTGKDEIVVETLGGNLRPRLLSDGRVTVHMGTPRFEPSDVPFIAERRSLVYHLELDDTTVPASVLSIGNPHAVQLVDDVARAPGTTQGPRIEAHPRFPKRVNAGYLQIIDRSKARMRVWERGAGETLGCGSGACAAVIA